MIGGTASLSDLDTPGNNIFRRDVQTHDLPCNKELGCVAISSQAIHQQFKTLPHPFHFATAEDIPKTLGALLFSNLYAKDTRPLCAVGPSRSLYRSSSPVLPTFEVIAVDSDAEDVAELFVDHDTTGKKTAARDLEPQRYTREEVWFITFQIDDV